MPSEARNGRQHISTLNEKPLHAALKTWYARPGDRFEVEVDGFLVDIVRGDLLIEIQTRSFAALKRKLISLTANHPLRLVYPVARERWIVRLADNGNGVPARRKSPKPGKLEGMFEELVSFPQLLKHPHFSVEVLLTQEEEIRRHEPGRAWRRRGWVTAERRLLNVVGRRLFESPADMRSLLPVELPDPFSTAELAETLALPRGLAQKMAYCLRGMDVIGVAGKRGNAVLYRRVGVLSGR
jgi:hypothetical protein